jgi:PAS domain S-box-containing protein
MGARESSETVPGEIRKSLGELRTIIDTIPALAWSSVPDGCVDFVNRRWQDYTGQSREQSQGPGWETAIHPEDLPGLQSKWEESRDYVADMCPNSNSRRICSKSSTLSLLVSQLRFRRTIHEAYPTTSQVGQT